MSTMTINGVPYNLDQVIAGAELNHLLFLKQKADVGMKSMVTALTSLEDTAKGIPDPVELPEDATDQEKATFAEAKSAADQARAEAFLGRFEDEDVLQAFRAIIWLARTKHGDRNPDNSYLTVEQANEGVSLMSMFVDDDESEDEAPDPKDEEPAAVPS